MCKQCNKEHRPLHIIAADIKANWSKVNYAARPYLDAMANLTCIKDTFGQDDAEGIVLYFLANASTFKGDDAKRLKAELKALCS